MRPPRTQALPLALQSGKRSGGHDLFALDHSQVNSVCLAYTALPDQALMRHAKSPCHFNPSLKNKIISGNLQVMKSFFCARKTLIQTFCDFTQAAEHLGPSSNSWLPTETESRVEAVFTVLPSVTLPSDSSSATSHHYFFFVVERMTGRNSHTLFDTYPLKGFTDFLPNLPTSVII